MRKFNISTPLLRDLFRLFFPERCLHCDTPLVGGERRLCLACRERLDNEVAPTWTATPWSTLCLMRYNGFTRNVVHAMKYHGNVALAHEMGRRLGLALAAEELFADVDLLLPIPLHPKKMRLRGYNQTLELCRGIAETFPRPISHGDLVRVRHTRSQTRFTTHEDRLRNLVGAFRVRHPEALSGKHILVVDDVLTSGATISAVVHSLHVLPATRFSAATLAIAR